MVGSVGSEDDGGSFAADGVGEVAAGEEAVDAGRGVEEAEDVREGEGRGGCEGGGDGGCGGGGGVVGGGDVGWGWGGGFGLFCFFRLFRLGGFFVCCGVEGWSGYWRGVVLRWLRVVGRGRGGAR